jgi:hypothetical protein
MSSREARLAQHLDGGFVPGEKDPFIEKSFAPRGDEAFFDLCGILFERLLFDGKALVDMDKDQSCGGVCWGAGISVLEFDDGGLDLLSIRCVEGDVARGEGFQRGGFHAGFLGGIREGFP